MKNLKTRKSNVPLKILLILLITGIVFATVIKLFLANWNSDDKLINSFVENKTSFESTKTYMNLNTSIQAIENDAFDLTQPFLKKIFQDLHYRGIHMSDTFDIYFVKAPTMGFSQGIMFSSGGQAPNGPYIAKAVSIGDGWYLFKMK